MNAHLVRGPDDSAYPHRLAFRDVDMRAEARGRLDAVLSKKGAELCANGYRTSRIILSITGTEHGIDGGTVPTA